VTTAHVVVVGSINVDLVALVDHIPAPGESVLGTRFMRAHGGKAGNAAAALGRLGIHTTIVGCIGADEFGTDSRAGLEAAGVDVSRLLVHETASTGVALIFVDPQGENVVGSVSGANFELTPELLEQQFNAIEEEPTALLINLEVPMPTVTRAVELAHARGWKVVMNPAPSRTLPDELLAKLDVLTPNAGEVDAVHVDGIDGVLATGCGAVVITRGAQGARIHRAGVAVVDIPAFEVDVVDTTGAGDAFSAALTGWLASGASLEESVEVAAAAGAITVQTAGARNVGLSMAAVTALRETHQPT
jgi:ribokinase